MGRSDDGTVRVKRIDGEFSVILTVRVRRILMAKKVSVIFATTFFRRIFQGKVRLQPVVAVESSKGGCLSLSYRFILYIFNFVYCILYFVVLIFTKNAQRCFDKNGRFCLCCNYELL